MYKNFTLTESEKEQILKQHKKHGYKRPLNEQSNDDSTQDMSNDVEPNIDGDNQGTQESNVTCVPTQLQVSGRIGNTWTSVDFNCGLGEDGEKIVVTVSHHSLKNSISVDDDNTYSDTDASKEMMETCVRKFRELFLDKGMDSTYISVSLDINVGDDGRLSYGEPYVDVE